MKKAFTIIFIIFCIFSTMQKSYSKTNVAIIGAVDTEVNYLQKKLNCKNEGINNRLICTGKIGNNNVVVVQSYVGKVNAALTTQYLIDNYNPKYILNIGTAGSFDKNIKIDTLIIADDLVQFDYDLSAIGHAKGNIDLPDVNANEKTPTFFKSDSKLTNSILEFAKKYKTNYLLTRIGTGDNYITNENEKQKYRKMFNINIVEMEGAAMAQTAFINNVPFGVIRIISDFGSGDEYNTNKTPSGELCEKFIYDFLLKNKL